jgi:hypothetical protein
MEEILKFSVHIKGIRPILFARFPEEDFGPEAPTTTRPSTQQEKFEKSLYRMEDGTLYQPSSHIVGAMREASKRFKLKGRVTFREVIEGGVFVIPEKIPHLIQTPLQLDWRSGVNEQMKGKPRIMIARGRLDEWELKFELHCWDPRANDKALKDILMTAGAYIGIGAYRPRYGRFEVVTFDKLKK